MRRLIWILIFILAIPIAAKNDDAGLAVFQPLEVSNVRLRLSPDEGIALIFNANPTVCEDLLIDVAVDGDRIAVNAYVPPNAGICNTFVAYEPVVALPDLETGQAYLLSLNDFTSTFFLTDVDEDSSTEPFAVLWGDDSPLIGFKPIAPIIDSIDFSENNGAFEVTLTGNHPDGCVTQEYTGLTQDEVQENLYHVEAFRLVPDMVICPDALIPFEAVIALAVENGNIVEVDGRYFIIEDGEALAANQFPLLIDSVEILPTANGNIVAITGTQDCGFEVVAHVAERDFMSMIQLAAYESADAPCSSESTPFDESFTVANLPVVINGTAYDETGELSPPASGQSNTDESEGNVMAVDTVIENVEVAILESFPMQLQLMVSGYQPDGCDFPVEVVQSVEGNDVTLHIFRNVPLDAFCPMMLNPYEETIMVDGTFEGGTVNIQVNEFTTSVDL